MRQFLLSQSWKSDNYWKQLREKILEIILAGHQQYFRRQYKMKGFTKLEMKLDNRKRLPIYYIKRFFRRETLRVYKDSPIGLNPLPLS